MKLDIPYEIGDWVMFKKGTFGREHELIRGMLHEINISHEGISVRITYTNDGKITRSYDTKLDDIVELATRPTLEELENIFRTRYI